MRTPFAVLALLTAALSFSGRTHAAPVAPDKNHPILGIWLLQVPDTTCTETYRFRADGTTLVTSAEEISQSEFTIPAKPSATGYYKLTDRIVKDNGKKDCSGDVMKVGTSTSYFVRFNDDNSVFIMCLAESMDQCIGPFRRVPGQDI
ncbi:hypothetical protein [Zemynaea arenosa]|uniref:hypothetical protein n=1 Tax=Zemynaea arenosa TaxID=2561931 RepID=UPI001431A94F|nr:hypothetical protein [Massilia arenosa]